MKRNLTGIILIFLSTVASANVGDIYGFGSRAAGLSSATAAYGFNGFSAYSNPALLASDDPRRILVDWALLYMHPDFEPITGILTENKYVYGRDSYGSADTGYRDTFGQSLGLTARLFPEWRRFTIGVVTYMPASGNMYMDSGEPFAPEFALYRTRTQRPQVHFAFGAALSPWVTTGAGVFAAFAVTGRTDVFVQTDTSKPSSMRLAASLKPKVGPYLGINVTPPHRDETSVELGPLWAIGSVVRFPVSSPAYFDVGSGARALGNLAQFDFHLNAQSTLQYDPLTVELGVSFREKEKWRTYVQLDYQAWKQYKKPTIEIKACDGAPCGIVVSDSKNPSYAFRDIWIPRLAQELKITPSTTLRASYAYRPGIITEPPKGPGNLVDPSQHIVALGAGFHFKHLLGIPVDHHIDVHLSFHRLISQRVTKDPGDETGNSSDSKIGSPGYVAAGKIYGGGVSMSLEF